MKAHFFEALKTALIGGIISGIISGMLNYFIFPFPVSISDNVISHTMGGFFCGTITAVIAIIIFTKKSRNSINEVNN